MAQVAPDYQPYSITNPHTVLHASQFHFDDDPNIDFIQNAHMSICPDGVVYRLSIIFLAMSITYSPGYKSSEFLGNFFLPNISFIL